MARPRARRLVLAIAALAAGGALSFAPANSVLTQRHYAPIVERLAASGGAKSSPTAEYETGKKFFAANGLVMPNGPGLPRSAGASAPVMLQGLPVYRMGREFTRQEEERMMDALVLLDQTKAPAGGSWLDVVKSAGPLVTVGPANDAAGEMTGTGEARPFFSFKARMTEQEIDDMLGFKPSLYLRGETKGGLTNVTFGVYQHDIERDKATLSRLLRAMKGRVQFEAFEPSGRYAFVRIDEGLLGLKAPEEIARTLAHEAGHGLWEQAHFGTSTPQRIINKGHEKFAFTTEAMFLHDAERQRMLTHDFQARRRDAKYFNKYLALDRLGLYQQSVKHRPTPARGGARRR